MDRRVVGRQLDVTRTLAPSLEEDVPLNGDGLFVKRFVSGEGASEEAEAEDDDGSEEAIHE